MSGHIAALLGIAYLAAVAVILRWIHLHQDLNDDEEHNP